MFISNRRWSALGAALGATLFLVAMVGPVGAATPSPVTIVTVNDKTTGTGTFQATGSAVESRLLCARGTVVDTDHVFGGYESARKVQVQARKEFTCSDGSGTFFVKIQIHAVFGGDEPFSWVVQDGTGDYEGLGGAGDGVTSENTATSNVNSYEGFVVP
jgi:hypothetical protein